VTDTNKHQLTTVRN